MKYRISKFYIGVYIICFLFCAVSIYLSIISIRLWWTEGFDFSFLIMPVVAVVFSLLLLYQTLFDFQFGKFSVDEQGITLYIGFKAHQHRWDEFRDYGILGVSVESMAGKNVASAYWIYFATYYLGQQERVLFLSKTRRDLTKVAFFQYNEKTLHSVLPYMPEEIADKLTKQECQLKERMNLIERLYNK